jgi:hypothetical protein
VRTAREIAKNNTLTGTAALDYVAETDKTSVAEWESGAKTKDGAYGEGSEAIGEDGKVYTCAPAAISGAPVPKEDLDDTP